MRPYSALKMAFPGIVLVAACLPAVPSRAQVLQAVGVGTRSGSSQQSQVIGRDGNLPAQNEALQAITLDAPTGLDVQADMVRSNGEALPPEPANFRRLGEATVGQPADLHTLTLRFSQATRITGISVTGDFKVEQGGSCVEGNIYDKGSTCRLLVRFTPQGPGNRLGKLTVTHSASATPDAFGLGGYGYSPVISFIPSIITTVPGTYLSSTGLLSGAKNLTLNGGDTLYVADIGNDLIREIDSSGAITNITPVFSDSTPASLAVDSFGYIWAAGVLGDGNYFSEYAPWGGQGAWSTTYNPGTCTPSAPCSLTSVGLESPANVSIDANDNLFMEESTKGAAEMPVGTFLATGAVDLWYLADTFSTIARPAFAVNAYDYLFTGYTYTPYACLLVEEPVYGAESATPTYTTVAGTVKCGFSGDGGQATNAEIGAFPGQITFDAAGNLYFTDTNNQRVRRIDNTSGIIRTVAGNGTAGYSGDGGGAPGAELSSPTGVAVDSQGQVYIISSATTGQVIRKVTAAGIHSFPNQAKGVHSAPYSVAVSNTGNSTLTLTASGFKGNDPGDFAVDPLTTSCVLTPGATLDSGQTCTIGFVFTPSAVGARSATFVMTDNTATNSNTIDLFGSAAANFTITSPSNGASFTSGTGVVFKVSLTSAAGPAPTGTVQFKVDGTNYGSPVTVSSGAASTTVTGLSIASHTLSATYSGDSNYAAGGPISVTITVTTTSVSHQPKVTMSPIAKTDISCVPQMFNVTVSSTSGIMPTGTVRLLDGSRIVSTATLVDGKAVLSSPPLAAGTHSFTTEYSGDAHNLPAVSTPVVETISQSGQCSQPVEK